MKESEEYLTELRDRLALGAMSVLLADQSLRESDDLHVEEIARDAYLYADAMMQERKKWREQQ